jgi:hypothetical protein
MEKSGLESFLSYNPDSPVSITSTVDSFTENRVTPIKFLDMGFKTA